MSETDDVRRRVLEASVALDAEQGVRAVSFREVARRAGVSHQAPYHHFGNHHGILRAIAAEGFTALTAAMTAAAAATPGDPKKGLHAAGVAYVTFALEHVGHFRVMFQRPAPEGAAPDALPEADATYPTLVRLCTEAHRAGIGRGLSVPVMSHLAWSTVHGLAMLLIEGLIQKKVILDEATMVRQVVGGLTKLLEAGAR